MGTPTVSIKKGTNHYFLEERVWSGGDRPDYKTLAYITPEEAYAIACSGLIHFNRNEDAVKLEKTFKIKTSQLMYVARNKYFSWDVGIRLPAHKILRSKDFNYTLRSYHEIINRPDHELSVSQRIKNLVSNSGINFEPSRASVVEKEV